MRKNCRGSVGIDLLIIATVVTLVMGKPSGGPGKDHWWQFWRKNPIEQVDKSQADKDRITVEEKAKVDAARAAVKAENDKQLASAHDASVATVVAIDAAQQKAAAGSIPVKELETAKKTATITKDSLDAATGAPVDPVRVRELELMVSNLNSGIAAGTKSLEIMQGVLDASIGREKTLEAKVTEVEKIAATKISAADQKVAEEQKKANTWALERDSIARSYENFKFYAFLAVGGIFLLWLASWLLPILARSFPALEALSHTVGAVWAPGVQIVKNQATRLNEDFVAMTEVLKKKLAEKMTPEELEKLKTEISTDWMTTGDGSAEQVERLKAKLRL